MKRRLAWALAALLQVGCLAFHGGPLPGEPAHDTFIQVEGARVRYLDVGRGPAVVLLHGFASTIEDWWTVIPALKAHHRVLALDLKGFGWSDRSPGDYSPTAQAAVVRALMNERGIEQAAFVAHSWGASVALAFALETPERVTRLALYDAFVYDDQLPPMFHLAKAKGLGEALFAAFYDERPDERIVLGFFNPEIVNEAVVEEIEKVLKLPGTRAAALEAVRGMNFTQLSPRYKQVAKPTLLLWGREDVVAPTSIGERLLRQLPNAAMKVYPRCGHFPMFEAVESTRDLLAFLEPERSPR